jgi:hypothetical protein
VLYLRDPCGKEIAVSIVGTKWGEGSKGPRDSREHGFERRVGLSFDELAQGEGSQSRDRRFTGPSTQAGSDAGLVQRAWRSKDRSSRDVSYGRDAILPVWLSRFAGVYAERNMVVEVVREEAPMPKGRWAGAAKTEPECGCA